MPPVSSKKSFYIFKFFPYFNRIKNITLKIKLCSLWFYFLTYIKSSMVYFLYIVIFPFLVHFILFSILLLSILILNILLILFKIFSKYLFIVFMLFYHLLSYNLLIFSKIQLHHLKFSFHYLYQFPE